jgi:hypothetical protein
MKKYKKYIDDPNYEFVPYETNKKGLGGDIGAGVAGVASGIAGSLLPGQLGSMAIQGIDTIHGALDKDITKQEQMISGYGKAAGGIGTAIATGGASLSTGFDDIATGLGKGISNTPGVDPKTGQIVNTVSSLAGLAGGFMGGDAAKVADASKLGNVMGNIPMAYGGYLDNTMYEMGGMLGDPPQLQTIDNVDDNIIQSKPAPYVWDLKNYKEQQNLITGVDPTTGLPTYVNQKRTPRLIAHGKNIINSFRPNNVRPELATRFAMGGQLTEFEGQLHEDGGIPLGDSNNEVEGGETASKEYIYSDQIKLPWNKKKTFAEESKRISAKYKGRESDVLAKKSMEIELDKLRDMQESTKQDMMAKAQSSMQKTMQMVGAQPQQQMQQQQQMPDGTMMQDEQYQMQQPQEQQMPNSEMLQGQMAYGGKIKYFNGGTFSSEDLFSSEDPYAYVPKTQQDLGLIPLDLSQYQVGTKNVVTSNNLSGNIPTTETVPIMQNYNYGTEGPISPDSYVAEKGIDINGLVNQLNSGEISKQQYDEALANWEDGLNASHLNPNYADPFNQPDPSANDAGTKEGQTTTNNTNTNANTNLFNEKLTTGEKVASFIPAAAQAFSLIGGPEKTTYAQLNPRYVDYETQRTGIRKESAAAKLQAMKNIRNIAGNSGRALSNMVAANTGIYDAAGSQLNKSYGDEYNTNTGIYNQTNQANVGIQNTQNDINAANRAKYRDQMLAAVVNASSAYKGIKKDDRAYASNNIFNNAAMDTVGNSEYITRINPETGRVEYILKTKPV